MSERLIPFAKPSIGPMERSNVEAVLESGWLTAGPWVSEFERLFADRVQARYAIAVNSCTMALRVALQAVSVGPGDEVIVPTLTYTATASAVVELGAIPVLVDVLPTGHLDPSKARRAVSRRTRAVVPVHYAGAPCELQDVREAVYRHPTGRTHTIAMVEDAAHAVGTWYGREPIGHRGIACFSFYATKNLTCGEGGMITVNEPELAHQVRLIAGQGITNSAMSRWRADEYEYDVASPGVKGNMSDIHAAIGVAQMGHLDEMLDRRQDIAERYDEAFMNAGSEIRPLPWSGYGRHSHHLYPVHVPDRDLFRQRMHDAGVDTSVHFIPLHRMTAYRRSHHEFPVAEQVFANLVSLPLYPAMSDEDVEYVIQNALKASRKLAITHESRSGQV